MQRQRFPRLPLFLVYYDSGICRDSGRYITRRRWRDRRPLRLRDRFVAKRLALAAFVMVVVALVFYLRSVTPFGGVHEACPFLTHPEWPDWHLRPDVS
jgi:hypothetical protein